MEYYGILSRIVEWKQPETVKWRNKMADYKKMYAVLCGAIDQVIEPLSRSLWHALGRRFCGRRCCERRTSMWPPRPMCRRPKIRRWWSFMQTPACNLRDKTGTVARRGGIRSCCLQVCGDWAAGL